MTGGQESGLRDAGGPTSAAFDKRTVASESVRNRHLDRLPAWPLCARDLFVCFFVTACVTLFLFGASWGHNDLTGALPRYPRRGGFMGNKIIAVSIALVTVFLLGFLPQYVKASHIETELRQTRGACAGADLRDLIGLAYLQSNQKNFGLASATTGQFFNRVREMVGQMQDSGRRKALEDILAPRDRITAELARGDAAVIVDLQDLFIKTRAATGGAGAQ
jgi:hypothetical protein